MFESKDDRLLRLARERVGRTADEWDSGVNDFIASLEHLANTDLAAESGFAPQLRAEARMFADIRDITDARTPNQVLQKLQARLIDPRLVGSWLKNGAIHLPEHALAILTSYPEFEASAVAIIEAALREQDNDD